MEPVAENAPQIIEAAAQSTLGVLALIVLVVGVVAVILFRNSPDNVKLACFSMIFVGAAGFGLAVVGQAADRPDRAEASRPADPDRDAAPDETPDRPASGPDAFDDRPPALVAEPPPDRTDIAVAYAGDLYGCGLDLTFEVDGQTLTPSGNLFQIRDVAVGRQPYEVYGSIACPGIGMCEASGEGTLAVRPGATFDLSWGNDAPGGCTVILTGR